MFANHNYPLYLFAKAPVPGWVKTRMGGDGAAITPQQSVAGMVAVVAELDAEDNGHFYDYQGRELPW